MAALTQAGALIAKELKVLLRDRQTLALLFLMPATFVLFLSLALGNVYREKVGVVLPVVVDFRDDAEYAERVREILDRRPELRLVEPGAAEAAKAKAHVTVPEGFSDGMAEFVDGEGAEPFSGPPLEWRADETLDASYRSFVEASLALATLQAVLDSLLEEEDEFVSDDARAEARDAARRFVVPAPGAADRPELPTPLQQTVPGWSLFAMFFIVIPLSGSLMRDRQDGTLRRLLTYPVSRATLVAGKLAPYLLINVVQFAAMLAVGTLVVPLLAEQSLRIAAPHLLLLVTVAAALAATGYGLLVASLARTPEQAAAFGGTSVVVMAVIGGVMVPRFVMPAAMQQLAYVSPLYWGLEAYHDVFLRGAGVAALLPEVGVLAAFGAACLGVAGWRLRGV